jgi:hypothetical protein
MIRLFYLTIFIGCIVMPAGALAENVPLEVGGFRLGTDITDYPDVEYTNYLKEVVVTDWHGFRRGTVYYGICELPGTIIRIKMKYEDDSQEFYETLLKEFKKRYGKPDEWKGDAFGINYVWKWSFTDESGNQVVMHLQHNHMDHNLNIGNMVKLSYPELEERERLCFIAQCELNKPEELKDALAKQAQSNWDYLIPR